MAEPSGGGRGGSSTLPHKRNPVGSALARACARQVRGAASVLLEAMAGEHERAAGAWHSEWAPLTDALALTGGAAAAMAEVLEGLEVRPERMAANLDATGGLLMAESVTMAMAADTGRLEGGHRDWCLRTLSLADEPHDPGEERFASDFRRHAREHSVLVDRAGMHLFAADFAPACARP